jgi:PAS domain S-box-containing protein
MLAASETQGGSVVSRGHAHAIVRAMASRQGAVSAGLLVNIVLARRIPVAFGIFHGASGWYLPLMLTVSLTGLFVGALVVERKAAAMALRRRSRALTTLSRCNKVLVRATNEDELLRAACRTIVEAGGYRRAWVGYAADDEDKSIRVAAESGIPEGDFTRAGLSSFAECGRDPVGTALRTGQMAVIRNVATRSSFPLWRPHALEGGYASVLALPLKAEGGTFGAIGIYAAEQDAFDTEEVSLLEGVASDLAYGVVTLRMREEHAHAEAEKLKLAAAMDQMGEGVLITDLDGAIRYMNPAYTRITGYAPTELVGKNAGILSSGKHDLTLFETLFRTIQTGETWRGEITNRRKDGSIYPEEMTVTPVKDAQGRLTSFIAIKKDITERKLVEAKLARAKEAAEAANLAKTQFLGNMSHELRTPLNGILGMTGLALGTELTAEQREFVAVAKSSAESLLALVNDLLDFARMELGTLEITPFPFPLRESVAAVMRRFAPSALEKGLTLMCKVRPGVPEVVIGDPARLRQVIANLVGNAIKFTKQGEVAVLVETYAAAGDGESLHVAVRDTGIGIAPEQQQLIFKAFTQADGSATRAYGGTGLGLTLAARLAQMMGGRVWMESSLGRGSTFHCTVRMPAATHRESDAVVSTRLQG